MKTLLVTALIFSGMVWAQDKKDTKSVASAPTPVVAPPDDLKNLKKELEQEKARTAYAKAKNDFSNALMQADAQFGLNAKQNAARTTYATLISLLGCKGPLDDEKLTCQPVPEPPSSVPAKPVPVTPPTPNPTKKP